MEQTKYIKKLNQNYSNLTYAIKTFGCQMNINDSMKIHTLLMQCGLSNVDDIYDSDILIVNTCCVRENAENKVLGLVGNIKKLKETRKDIVLIVLGCMMQQEGYAASFMKKNPQVDVVLGTSDFGKLPEYILNAKTSNKSLNGLGDSTKPIDESIVPMRKNRISELVTIMRGCNNFCTYCAVPYVRGRERSRKPKNIITEINELALNGTKEVVLLGQNVNSYGKVLDINCDFSDLINQISKETDLQRIRFMTSHPKDLSQKLIDTIASNPIVCNHIHLPIQSGSNATLKAMNRKYTREYYIELCQRIRKAIPEILITTDIIVGFPGESDADFLDTLDLIKRVEFASAFMFKYSKRSGTPANEMANQIDEKTKSNRLQQLLTAQEAISNKISQTFVGKKVEVLIESTTSKVDNIIGRNSQNLPIYIENFKDQSIGSIIEIEIVKTKNHTLIGKL